MRGSQAVRLENESPLFQALVDRTFFASRETHLIFDAGVLRDVQIKKPSEVVGFVEIPLVLAQSIVALPAQIVQVRIDQTNNRLKLIEAQNELLKTKTENLKLRETLPTGSAGTRSLGGGVRSTGGVASFSTFTSASPAGAVNFCMANSCGVADGFCQKKCECAVSCTAVGRTMQACLNLCD